MKEQILAALSADCPWKDRLHWYDVIGSTNTKAKELALCGAPHGTILIAGSQTGGRGRLGRSFSSPAGMGVYLTVILRPQCAPSDLMHLTCASAVAMCDAVAQVCAIRPGIKWTNDLVYEKKKLGGILTELSADPDTGLVDYAIIGIGINCCQQLADFPPELQNMAASLSMVSGASVSPATLSAAMVEALVRMDKTLFTEKDRMLAKYRTDCITLGQDVMLVRGEETTYAEAIDLDPDGGLLVRLSDGTIKTVTSGEVSVRGMYGYI